MTTIKAKDMETLESMFGNLEPYYEREETSAVEKVEKGEDGWTITTEDSMGCYIQRKDIDSAIRYEVEPKVGDKLTTYTYGGMRIAGFALNGERLFLKTERELNLEWALYRAQHARAQEARFERERNQLDTDYANLPQIFRDRIDRFRSNNPDFRKEYEGYEMFVCKQAVAIAERARAAGEAGENQEEVDEFWASEEKRQLATYPRDEPWSLIEGPPEMRWVYWWWAQNSKAYDYDYERMEKLMPEWSDGHSGNTAGAAFTLARAYMEAPEYVSRIHGALSPLVGSKAYGDIPPEEQ
jgi:hypothetical protein